VSSQVPSTGRIQELDVLRAVAIAAVLLCHLPEYVLGIPGLPSLWAYRPYAGVMGLGLFTFVSGYAIELSQERTAYRQSALGFAGRRIAKLFPLYIPAVLCFVVLFHGLGVWHHWTFAPIVPTVLIQLVGAQVLLSPRYQPMLTLWFVGAILMYYGLHFALTRLSKRTAVLAAYGAIVFVLAAAVRFALGVIGIQFVLYWFPFLAGVLCHRLRLPAHPRFNFFAVAAAALVAVAAGAGAAALRVRLFIEADSPSLSLPDILPSLVIANVFMLSGTVVAIYLAHGLATRMSARTGNAIWRLAGLSYAIYLFHRPCLAIVAAALQQIGVSQPIFQNLGVCCIGLPITLFIAASMHGIERRVTARIGFSRVESVSWKV
jgi:peptidoglycan/LPS O-acetylase OafA/YrhL